MSGGDDLALKMWNLRTSRELRTVRDAHPQRITCVGIVPGNNHHGGTDRLDRDEERCGVLTISI